MYRMLKNFLGFGLYFEFIAALSFSLGLNTMALIMLACLQLLRGTSSMVIMMIAKRNASQDL